MTQQVTANTETTADRSTNLSVVVSLGNAVQNHDLRIGDYPLFEVVSLGKWQ